MNRTLAALALVTTTLAATPALAQPGRTPEEVAPSAPTKDDHKSKSDANRLVGKVLAVDKQRGMVKLETDTEGVRDVKANTTLINAIRVGDMISVLRSPEDALNASPR